MTRHAPLRATWSEGQPEALKPCPFCGGMAYRHELIEHYPASADGPAGSYSAWFHIGCNVCGIEVGDEYESSAIAAWNRRTEAALQQQPVAPHALPATPVVDQKAAEGSDKADWSKVPPDQWPSKCPKCGAGLSYTSYEPYCAYADCRWNNAPDDAQPKGGASCATS